MNSKSRKTESQKGKDSRSGMALSHPHFFFFLFRKTPKVYSLAPPLMLNCFFSCRKSRKKGEQRLRRLKPSQMVNSNMKGKREPKRPFGDHFRAPRTEEIR